LNQISLSDRQWLELDMGALSFFDKSCPVCGFKGGMKIYSHYKRYLIELQANKPITHSVTIPRCRCSNCGHTQAFLSSALVPYHSYSLRFILYVLRSYFLHQKTVEQICVAFAISPSTLYLWKELFLRQKAAWLQEIDDIKSLSGSFFDELSGEDLRDFFSVFCFSFMERIPGERIELLQGWTCFDGNT